MRINKYIAHATGISRRAADGYITAGRATLNGKTAQLGDSVEAGDVVTLDDRTLQAQVNTTILLNKPVGYVCSRSGQGSKTVYDLLPKELHHLKPVGRLDKESSGLLVLTNDGDLANQLTHPSHQKQKVYHVALNKDLTERDFEQITKTGVSLNDGVSKFKLDFVNDGNTEWIVTMSEGRNRQIRRTFQVLGYEIVKLHRTAFGDYSLNQLQSGHYITL